MFWSNQLLKVREKDLEWGHLRFLQLGEYGRGRKPINITIPQEIGDIPAKQTMDYEIVLSKTGNPKLSPTQGTHVFLAIDTLGAYVRGAEGKICYLSRQQSLVRPVAFGWGAFGDAGRIGYAPAAILEVDPGVIILYKPTRSSSKLVYVTSESILHFDTEDIEPAIDAGVLDLSGAWKDEDWIDVQTLFND